MWYDYFWGFILWDENKFKKDIELRNLITQAPQYDEEAIKVEIENIKKEK